MDPWQYIVFVMFLFIGACLLVIWLKSFWDL